MLKAFLSSLIFLSMSGCAASPSLASSGLDHTLSIEQIRNRLTEEMIPIDYMDHSTIVLYDTVEEVYFMLSFNNNTLTKVTNHSAGEMMEILDGVER